MNPLKKWFNIGQKDIHKHNLKISANIGILTVHNFANNPEFKKCIERNFPKFTAQVNAQLRNIKN